MKKQFLSGIGELILIILGILIAQFINNKNASYQYQKQIDKNILRVQSELLQNIEETQLTIEKLKSKDSLIYLVMNDSVDAKMYYRDINLAYLILYYYNLNLEDKAYQNLMGLNISDNKYKEDVLTQLKELYSIEENIVDLNNRMSTFVYDKSLPLMAQNTKSFGDLTYKGQIKEDVVKYYTTSQEYKSYVSQYAIIAIKNQLRYNQMFIKEAYRVYSLIAKEYNLKNELRLAKDTSYIQYTGKYANTQLKDTLSIVKINDSLILGRNGNFKLNLVPFTNSSFFTDHESGGYFVTFYKNMANDSLNFKLNLLSTKYFYKKL